MDDIPDLGMGGGRPKKGKPPADMENYPAVQYIRVKCPKCGSLKAPVYDSSHLPIRYHRCSVCGLNFKSIEKTGHNNI